MNDTAYKRMKDLPVPHRIAPGTPICAGCGGLQAIQQIYDVLGEKTVWVNAAGCMTLLATYPFTPFSSSWLYTSMASAPAGAQGVRDALDLLLEKRRITRDRDLAVVVLAGDGSAYGMGLSATSGAIERGLDFIYVCYDNEGYGNTGQQASSATPHGAATATSKGPLGYSGQKKDLFAIWLAHRPAYAATAVASEPLDLVRKLERARQLKGPRLVLAFSPCPTGWGFDPRKSVEIGRLAVATGMFPLKEYVDGAVRHTKIPHPRRPVDEYLTAQQRFRHLFEPARSPIVDEIQVHIDQYWSEVERTEH
jgi:pyruvate ferredoxin oxidoreductase beta subunit